MVGQLFLKNKQIKGKSTTASCRKEQLVLSSLKPHSPHTHTHTHIMGIQIYELMYICSIVHILIE